VSVGLPGLSVEEDGNVTVVALDRPAKRNALTPELMDSLCSAFEAAHRDSTGGILLTGEGSTTCAGADLDVVRDGDEATVERFTATNRYLRRLIRTYPGPTVMACKGAVVGAGFGFSLDCDFAVLGAETTYTYPEIHLGLFGQTTPLLLAHLTSVRVAKEVVLTGEPVAPERAHELGLAFDVVHDAEVYGKVKRLLGPL